MKHPVLYFRSYPTPVYGYIPTYRKPAHQVVIVAPYHLEAGMWLPSSPLEDL